MTAVRVGRLIPGGKVHLALDGQIADNHLRRISIPCANPTKVALKNLCRRCFTPLRVGAAQRLLILASGSLAEGTRRLLADVADGMNTPEQTNRYAEMAEEIRAGLRATGVLRPVAPELAEPARVERRPESLAELRALYRQTHHQPTAA